MLCWADAFPASVTFDAIAAGLSASEADKKEALNLGKAIFAFTLTNDKGQTESWYLDLKKTGKVGKGPAPPGGKADGAFLFYPSILVLCLGSFLLIVLKLPSRFPRRTSPVLLPVPPTPRSSSWAAS